MKRFRAKFDTAGVPEKDIGRLIAETNDLQKLFYYIQKIKAKPFRVIISEYGRSQDFIPTPVLLYKLRYIFLRPWDKSLAGFENYEYKKHD